MSVKVGIVMGSDSDLSVMQNAAKFLDKIGIEYELSIASAHRTPDRTAEYVKSAKSRGIKVIIAGAGGAAHLPGVIAANTSLPVIGVPMKTSTLGGVDSLYSIVQMPSGIPVATVGINGAENAGILAAEIIGTFDEEVDKKIVDYKKSLEISVNKKAEKLEKLGYEEYLNQM